MNLRITPEKLEESGKILEKTCGLGPTQKKHRWKKLLEKRDYTGWIKWLDWDNNLKIPWTDWEWKRIFRDIFSTPEQMESERWMIKRYTGIRKHLKWEKEYDQHRKLELDSSEKKKNEES